MSARSRPPLPSASTDGRDAGLVRTTVAFGRVLRRAGIPVVPQQMAELSHALTLVGIADRETVRRAARALLVNRREDLEPFDLLFDSFWRQAGQPKAVRDRPSGGPQKPPIVSTYVTVGGRRLSDDRSRRHDVEAIDRTGTWSDQEVLRSKAFARMSADELEASRRLLSTIRWRLPTRRTRRRTRGGTTSEIDLRKVLRETSRLGSLPAVLPGRTRARKPRPLVLIADISGSMARYARLVLQLFHVIVRVQRRTEAFLFATRLTRVTPQLRIRNVDRAIEDASRAVEDWAGGTRVGECLRAFNQHWARRVLGRGAIVVILSDGCDRGDPALLSREMRRLALLSHRLVWLNPHLGHPDYAPRVAGMAAALPHVDDFLSARNVQSLTEFLTLLEALPGLRGARGTARPSGS